VFQPGQQVTLKEDDFGAATFVSWGGCDDTGYDDIHHYYTCNVLVPLTGRRVIATIGLGGATGPVIARVAGTGAPCRFPPSCSDGGAATSARLAFPGGVAVDDAGRLYIADTFDQEVRKVKPDGTISRIAGTGTPCSTSTCGDGGPATGAQLSNPAGVALDANGNLYIADTADHEVRRITPDGTITRFAGDGNYCASPPDCGDGGPASSARLTRPTAVAIDLYGNVYIADPGDNEVRRVSPNGTIDRLAGTGHVCATAPACGDGGPATSARLTSPAGVATDAGFVYVADTGNNEVRRITPDGTIELVAGNGTRCMTAPSCGDGGDPTSAAVSFPSAVAVDPAENVYIADTQDHEIRKAG
jgi:sugar lactone lactonase YvrE